MPYQINRNPVDLADLVGSKLWPTNPSEMADQLVSVYDATAGFRFRKRFGAFITVSPTAIGLAAVSFTIPANQAWFVENFSADATVLALANVQLGLLISEPGISGTLIPTRSYAEPGPLMPQNMIATVTWSPNRWFGPGTGFQAMVVQGAGIGAGQPVNTYVSGAAVNL